MTGSDIETTPLEKSNYRYDCHCGLSWFVWLDAADLENMESIKTFCGHPWNDGLFKSNLEAVEFLASPRLD